MEGADQPKRGGAKKGGRWQKNSQSITGICGALFLVLESKGHQLSEKVVGAADLQESYWGSLGLVKGNATGRGTFFSGNLSTSGGKTRNIRKKERNDKHT